jgi:hypothetical protein
VLSIAGVLVGVVGLCAGYYFYEQSVQERVPTFLVDPVRATIIDSSGPQLSDLSVLYKGKPVGNRSVTAVRVYFWNAGRMPIRRSDVLKPIECVLGGGAEVLDYRLLRSSRDITGMKLLPSPEDPAGRVMIDDILEKGDGGAIQIVYAGSRDATIGIEGVLVGAPQPTMKPVNLPVRPQIGPRGEGFVVLACGVFMLVVAFVELVRLRRGHVVPSRGRTGSTRQDVYYYFVLGVLGIVGGGAVILQNPARLVDVPASIATDNR